MVAAALFAYNEWDSARAGQASQEILEELSVAQSQADAADEVQTGDGMPTLNVGGYECIGVISVPSLDIELPVLAEWSYPLLRVAPCRYSGSLLTDDLVICAHNYARHFGSLLNVDIGADVYFTGVDGQRSHYIVSNRETLQPTSIDQMEGNSSNGLSSADWDLTLFTCDLDGRTRCAVRCVKR